MSGKSRRRRAKRKERRLAELSTSVVTPKPPSPLIPKKEPEKEQKTPFFGQMYGLFIFAVTVVGLAGSYLYLRPSVEIEVPSSNLTDTEGLFSRPFVIKNNSPWLSVYDVHAMCTVQQVVRGTLSAPQVEYQSANADYILPILELGAGERHSVPCSESVQSNKPIRSADVILSLDYIRPRVFFGHTATQQGYRAIIGGDGRAYWTPFVQRK